MIPNRASHSATKHPGDYSAVAGKSFNFNTLDPLDFSRGYFMQLSGSQSCNLFIVAYSGKPPASGMHRLSTADTSCQSSSTTVMMLAPAGFLLAFALLGAALTLPTQETKKGLLSFPVVHKRSQPLNLRKRDNVVALGNVSTLTYLLRLQIGTPPQPVEVVLDTGSFELWVDPTCATAATEGQEEKCNASGRYVPSLSSTYVDKNMTQHIGYGKGGAEIGYAVDNILVPGSSHGNGFNLHYNNLIDELHAQGITQSKAFSIALGGQYSEAGGVIIFGGVDTKKFSGKLHKFDNMPPQIEGSKEGPWRYWVQMKSVGVTTPDRVVSTYEYSTMPALLDTGSTWSYLPQHLFDSLQDDFNATLSEDGSLEVPCSTIDQPGTVDFTFGDLTIQVPYSEFISQLEPGYCALGVLSRKGSYDRAVLGDSFLRSAYVVFDQTNQHLYMAGYRDCGTNEQTLSGEVGAALYLTGECYSGHHLFASIPMCWFIAPSAFVLWGFALFL
ncbi:aspartic peptidase domain-containing protein [Apiosordaria backusii]|uniref:Aspartic peptidase domain-containing protein n=1 Tax=Apiosordaria backusii TaxID=314023 RepID=A0AA40EZV3_9PEZI|nr:aspartic peptidase domain-containing protein [Apiosordaria backusii]